MSPTRIKDIMTAHPTMAAPADTVAEVARQMKATQCGCLPVGSVGEVIGVITDRDITLRVVAEGLDPKSTPVSNVMTREVFTVDEEADVEVGAAEMRMHKLARLLVTRNGQLTGILTMSELLRDAATWMTIPKVLRELARTPHNHRPLAQ